MLMLPVDFENGDSSMGVEALSLVIDEGESNENDCERMRTFGLGVRGGAARRAAMIIAAQRCARSYKDKRGALGGFTLSSTRGV